MADDEGALAQLGIRKGQIAEGTALLGRGLTVWEEGGGRVGSPYLKSVLAEGMAELGNITRALDLVDEAIVQIGRPGWEGAIIMPKYSASGAGCCRCAAIRQRRSAPTSPRSTGRASNRQSPGSCAPRRAMPG